MSVRDGQDILETLPGGGKNEQMKSVMNTPPYARLKIIRDLSMGAVMVPERIAPRLIEPRQLRLLAAKPMIKLRKVWRKFGQRWRR